MFFDIDEQMYELYMEIEKDKYMMSSSGCPYLRGLYKNNILQKVEYVSRFINEQVNTYREDISTNSREVNGTMQSKWRQTQFTSKDLSQYDGSGGRPAYVAVDGTVYDVSSNPAWGGGTHFGLIAGKDLTEDFKGCHGAKVVLDKLPVVGNLVASEK